MSITKPTQPQYQSTVLIGTEEANKDDVNLEPYLVILSGPDQGKQHRLHHQFNTLGRTSNTDIKINDTKISREHGVIIIYPDHVVLKDHQSTNGCYVNDKKVENQVIESTTRIRLGTTLMKIEYKNSDEVESEIKLYEAANTDALTNISNRRAFMIRAKEEISYCKRNNTKLAIVMCDIDYFKQTNDNFGHPAGDRVLKELAGILQTEMRKEDLLARFGGEEFIMLLRSTDVNSVDTWAERIREKVEQSSFVFEGVKIPTTLSIGVCSTTGDNITTLDALIKQADDALYQAKNNGRNRVVLC